MTYFPGNRIHKYGAVRTEVDGIKFASKREAKRYTELKLLERAGLIHNLACQPVYPLLINGIKIGKYIADFSYSDGEKIVVEDVKGMRTDVYKLKKKLVEALYPNVKITEV